MIKEPDISKDFTISDIHKIRNYHYLLRKEIGDEEFRKYSDKVVSDILKDMPNVKRVKIDNSKNRQE